MHLRWKPRDRIDLPYGYLYLVVISGFGGLAYFTTRQLYFRCPFKLMTGLPCPSCGMTRSLGSILGGRPLDAFFYNPGAVMACAGMGLLLGLDIWGYHHGKKLELKPSLKKSVRLTLLLALLFLINWSYLIYTGI